MSMQKGDLCEGVVTALGSEGEGIISVGGTTAFVPFCLVGERVQFRALKVKNGIAYGKVEKILSASPLRTSPPCPVFGKCGGCDLQHMSYPAQLQFKRTMLMNTLGKIGGFRGLDAQETVACEKPFRYRNKLALPIGVSPEGRTQVGFYARRSHRIVPVSDCLIQAEWAAQVIAAVERFSDEYGYAGYDEVKRTGVLRRIVVRGIGEKHIVALVVAKRIDVTPLISAFCNIFGDFTFLLNINPSSGNAILSDNWQVLRGTGRFEAEEQGIVYEAGAETFVQVNDGVRSELYGRILAEAAGADTVIDLYSGGGLLTAMLARACGRVYGVEVVPEAVSCANALCRRNGLEDKMINICGRAEDELGGILSKARGKTTVVCDPPRKGMESTVSTALRDCGAEKIILVSCNPATLARDMKILCDGPYNIVSLTPFDMFPQTKHLETLAILRLTKISASRACDFS